MGDNSGHNDEDPKTEDPKDAETERGSGSRLGWGSRLQDLKIGDAVGGFVRRVGAMVEELADQDRLSTEAKPAWAAILEAWLNEDFAALDVALQDDTASLLPETLREGALLLAACQAKLLSAPLDTQDASALGSPAANELIRRAQTHADETKTTTAPLRVWHAGRALLAGKPELARDELRRARASAKDLPRPLRNPYARLHALLSAQAWAAQGEHDKAARALEEARALADEHAGGLALRVDLLTVELWLALDRLDEADAMSLEWGESPRPAKVAARARVCASRQELDSARRLRSKIASKLSLGDAAKLALLLDPPADALAKAGAWLQQDPQDPARLRVWALARVGRQVDLELDPAQRKAVLDALAQGVDASAGARGGRAVEERARELAFVAMRLGATGPELDTQTRAALAEHGDREALLFDLLSRAQSSGPSDLSTSLDGAGRPRLPPGGHGAPGPDELSCMRDAELYERTVASRAAFVAGVAARARDDAPAAHALFVEALVEEDGFSAARQALAAHRPYPADGRLESILAAMTERLGALPQESLGLAVAGLSETLEQSIAARERLVRPLTIAIMGEFSAGKSTFVNAWLGRALAPMGALPTTCTINVFRRGGQGHARVHRRDAKIEHVDAAQVPAYLAGLDETAAAQIRHVEIERGDAGFGEATVVDTPGLNALDPYHEQVAREFLAEADAIVWIFSATRGAAESERAMLEELRGDGRRVLGVLNKSDVLEPGEREELTGYLRERLGEVLVDVVPFCATDALKQRLAKAPGDESMAQVEASLETHFLRKARALKSEVVRRRVLKALANAREGAQATAAVLESRAADSHTPKAPALRVRLQSIGDRLSQSFGEAGDLLMRELLSMGVLEIGEGLCEGRPKAADLDYIARRLSAELCDAVRAVALASNDPNDGLLLELVSAHALPWIQGHTRALASSDALRKFVELAGAAAANNESAVRESMRVRLQTIGAGLTESLRGLDRVAAASYAAHARREGGRPRAEALRLRVLVDGELSQAASALQSLDFGD